jgi:hypothetical protein
MARNVRVIHGCRSWDVTRADARTLVEQGAVWRQRDGSPISEVVLRHLGGESQCLEILAHDQRGRSGSGGTASQNPSGGIPGRGVGMLVKRADGTEVMERPLDKLQRLATSKSAMAAFRHHFAKETPAGAMHVPPCKVSASA